MRSLHKSNDAQTYGEVSFIHFISETNEPMVIKYGTGISYWNMSGKLNFGLYKFKNTSSHEALVEFDYPKSDSHSK
jgi:hypothetical protein